MGSTYIYTSLPSEDSIRLLVLAPGTSDDLLRFSLAIHKIAECPEYEALSYAWGDPTMNQETSCENSSLLITINLAAALRKLRHVTKPRVLWADAVCIDQKNIPERNQQVILMRDIYSKAARTLVWLGEAREVDEEAFKAIRQFSAKVKDMDRPSPELAAALSELVMEDNDESTGGGKRFNRCMSTILKSLDRPWFERTWIIQEVVIVSWVRILCGEQEVDWPDFITLFSALTNHPDAYNCMRFLSAEHQSLLDRIKNIFLLWVDYYFDPTMSLMVVFRALRHQKVTDPKDRVYGLLGLIKDERVSMIKVDYNQDLRDLYIQTAQYTLSSSKPFLTFSAASQRLHTPSTDSSLSESRCRGLPSWVPDIQFLNGENPFTGHEYGFSASRDSQPTISFEGLHGEILVLRAMPVKKLRRVLSFQKFVPSFPHSQSMFMSWIISCHLMIHQATPYPTGESSRDVSWRTMICDMSINGMDVRSAKQVFGDFYLRNDVNKILQHFGNPAVVSDDEEMARYQRLYYANHYNSAFGLDFFLTDDGYVGWGNPGCQEGDIVFVVPGSNAPIIFRQGNDDSYQLIGDAYVHGIMQGEAYDENGNFEFLKVR